MGYKPPRKVFKLDFASTEYEGLEVTLRGLSTAQYLDLVGSKDTADEDDSVLPLAVLELMAERLVDWNIEDDDGPVAPTLENLKAQDLALNLAIVQAWTTALGGVSDPLPNGSPSGGPSQVASIPTETLSPSPESYATPA